MHSFSTELTRSVDNSTRGFASNIRMAIGLLIAILLSANSTDAYSAKINLKKLDKQKWILVSSPNFEIVSDVKTSKVKKIAEQLERFRAFSSFFVGGNNLANAQQPSPNPMRLLLIQSNRLWTSFGFLNTNSSYTLSKRSGGTFTIAGVREFSGQSLRSANSGRANAFRAIAFDALHQSGAQLTETAWYKSGLLDYLSGYTESYGVIRLGETNALGTRLDSLFDSFGRFMLIDTADLMSRTSLNTDPVTGHELDNNETVKLHAQAFVMLHYFFANEQRRAKLARYLHATETTEQSPVTLLQEHMGMSPRELAVAIRRYKDKGLVVRAFDQEQFEHNANLPKHSAYSVKKLNSNQFWSWFAPMLKNTPKSFFAAEDNTPLLEHLSSMQ